MMNPTIIAVRPMIYSEAKECVNQINTNMTNIRLLVLDLYEREGWVALGYQSWRECVVAEFKQNENYLYRQLEAAQVQKNILPIGKNEIAESQLRPLIKLRDNPAQQREAWQKAVETAPEGKVTAAHVARVVKGMTEPEEIKGCDDRRNKAPTCNTCTEAMQFAVIAISQLERIRNDDPDRVAALNRVKNWINNKL
jgi:hypothetical protein